MSTQPLMHDIPENDAAPAPDPAAVTRPRTPSGATLFAVPHEVARTMTHATSHTTRQRAAASDVAATLADITSAVLAAVAAAQYASIAWARGRWLTGEAPTHPIVSTLDASQATLGQGPCLDALREQHAVTIPDMGRETRWPVFAARAAELGVGSMVSLPLSVRQEGLGVLNLYARRSHAFTGDDETIGSVFAARAAIALYRAAERDHVRAQASRDVIGQARDILMERHHATAVAIVDGLVRDSRRTGLNLADLARRLINERVHDDPDVGPSRTARRLDMVRTVDVANGLRVTCGKLGDAVVVQASGEVDLHTAPDLAAALRAGCVAARPSGALVIDLTGIRFFSACGLTLLLTTQRYCHERQLTLRVVATHRSVLRLLRITGLDALFDIAPTLEEATRPHGA